MELWKEILCNDLIKGNVKIKLPRGKRLERLFELECYKSLLQIKEILDDDSLNDKDCFMKIESIVSIFEALGTTTSRHDF